MASREGQELKDNVEKFQSVDWVYKNANNKLALILEVSFFYY